MLPLLSTFERWNHFRIVWRLLEPLVRQASLGFVDFKSKFRFRLVIVIGGFLLNYDNFVAQSYEKGASGDLDNKRVATFLETYKKGECASAYWIRGINLICVYLQSSLR